MFQIWLGGPFLSQSFCPVLKLLWLVGRGFGGGVHLLHLFISVLQCLQSFEVDVDLSQRYRSLAGDVRGALSPHQCSQVTTSNFVAPSSDFVTFGQKHHVLILVLDTLC